MTALLQTVDQLLESWPILAVVFGVILRGGLAWQKGLPVDDIDERATVVFHG